MGLVGVGLCLSSTTTTVDIVVVDIMRTTSVTHGCITVGSGWGSMIPAFFSSFAFGISPLDPFLFVVVIVMIVLAGDLGSKCSYPIFIVVIIWMDNVCFLFGCGI